MLPQLAFLIVLPLSNFVLASTSCTTTGSDVISCRTCPSRGCNENLRIYPYHKDNYDCMFLEGEMVAGQRYSLIPNY